MESTPEPDPHTAFCCQILDELMHIGADLARMLHAQAKAQAEAAQPDPAKPLGYTPEAIESFDRIARALRRTVSLSQRLRDPAPSPANRRASARRQIIREVEDAIQRRDAKPADKDRLQAEFLERLDGPDLDDDIDHRPVPDIIADICRDLGLAAPPGLKPWKRRTPADIATLCAQAARPTPTRATRDPLPPNPERFFHLFPTPIDA